MNEQINLAEYMCSVTYDRDGRQYPAREWMMRDRCELCKHWERFPVADQPPAGWGVYGQCDAKHDPAQVGYIKTDKTDLCDMYEGRY